MPADHRPADVLSPPASPQPGIRSLLASVLPTAVLVPIASTIVAVALPAIMADLDLGTTAVWWLVTGYLLLVATLQTPAGRLGDLLGQRRLLLAGTILLGTASVAAAMASGSVPLIAARLLQGAAGAAVVPAGLALIRRHVPDGGRGRAVGQFTATMAGGGVIGVVAGGMIVAAGGWQAAFVALTVLSALTLPPQLIGWRAEPARPAQGTRPSPQPCRTVMLPAAGVALVNLSFYVVLLVVPLLLDAEGSSIVVSGLLLGAFILASAAGALTATRVGVWIGRRRSLRVGAGAAAVALLGPTLLPTTTTWLAGSLILAGAGLGMMLSRLFTVGLDRARRENAGAISGLLSTARYTGSITGTAALPPLLAAGGPTTGLLLAAGAATLLTTLPWAGPAGRPHPQRARRATPDTTRRRAP